jgi:serine/threonine protein kinase
MEYGGGNSLEQFIKNKTEGRLSEEESAKIFIQVLKAVAYLDKMNIVHRDLKTENILLNKHLELKIIDFGFSLICPS